MAPYPNTATDTDFGTVIPADHKPTHIDEHEDPAPYTRNLYAVLTVYFLVLLVGVPSLVGWLMGSK